MGKSIKQRIRDFVKANQVTYAQVSLVSPRELLKGMRIIVTGGTGGIGQALAKRFVQEGATVLITGRDEEALNRVCGQVGCLSLPLDLAQVETFPQFVSRAEQLLGGIDCLVNNAGVSLHEKTFMEVTPEGFDQQISTNYRGPFFLTQQVIAKMLERQTQGQVLFISSETGDTADVRPYGLTKAAVNSLVQGLAYLYVGKGIRVNAVAPGVTATRMAGYGGDVEDINCPFNPNGRVYVPEEVAEVAVFLLSPSASSLSGQVITCNNGKTINARWK